MGSILPEAHQTPRMGKAVSIELRVQVSCSKFSCPFEELLGFLSERGVPGQSPEAEIDGSRKCLDILGEYGIVDIIQVEFCVQGDTFPRIWLFQIEQVEHLNYSIQFLVAIDARPLCKQFGYKTKCWIGAKFEPRLTKAVLVIEAMQDREQHRVIFRMMICMLVVGTSRVHHHD